MKFVLDPSGLIFVRYSDGAGWDAGLGLRCSYGVECPAERMLMSIDVQETLTERANSID